MNFDEKVWGRWQEWASLLDHENPGLTANTEAPLGTPEDPIYIEEFHQSNINAGLLCGAFPDLTPCLREASSIADTLFQEQALRCFLLVYVDSTT